MKKIFNSNICIIKINIRRNIEFIVNKYLFDGYLVTCYIFNELTGVNRVKN